MAFFQQTLHFLAAASFVFVNLVCPCVPANASQIVPTDNHTSYVEPAPVSCHEQSVVDSIPPHQECPECLSVLAISCEEQTPAVPAAPVHLVSDESPEHSIATSLVAGQPLPVFTAAFVAAMLPDCQRTDLVDSPVRRHDLQLE